MMASSLRPLFCLTVREVVWPRLHYFGLYMCAGFLGGSPDHQYFCGCRLLTALHGNYNSTFATIERVQRPGESHEGVGRKNPW